MALSEVDFPYSYYPDFSTGKPVFKGELYFGEPGLDPEIEANQVDVYGIVDGSTDPAALLAQPISTSAGGVPTYQGSPVSLLIEGDYSVKVLNKQGKQVYYARNKEANLTASTIGNAIGGYVAYEFDTIADVDTGETSNGNTVTLEVNDIVNTLGYFTEFDGGGSKYKVVAGGTGTEDGGEYINLTSGFQLRMVPPEEILPQQYGLKGDGTNEITQLQRLFFSPFRDRIVGRGNFKIESTLKLRTDTKVVGHGFREFRIYTDVDRNINLLMPENTGDDPGVITTDVWLENMEWDHNRLTDFTSETLMTFLCLCMKRVRVRNVLVTNPNTDGIYISDTYGGFGNVANQPDDIIIEDFKCVGDRHNRNGISVITGTNVTLRDQEYINMSRDDMPGAIDLEPNDATQLIQDIHIENIRFTNCKQGLVSDFVSDKTDNTRIQNVTVNDIFVNGTPVQSGGPYEEFVGSNSTCGVFMGRITNLKLNNVTVSSANSTSIEIDNCKDVTVNNVSVRDGRTHGIVFRDCEKIKLDNYDIDCANGEFNSIKTKGIYFIYRETGVDHIGDRDVKIGQGTVHLETTSADTFGLAGIGNIKDLNLSGCHFTGGWSDAVFQSDGSSGWPNNWVMEYSLEDGFSGTVAKFSITEGQTVNGKWRVPGFTNGTVSIVANTDIFIPTPFRVNASSIASCSLLTSNAEPASINATTAGNFQVVLPSSTTVDVYWELEQP